MVWGESLSVPTLLGSGLIALAMALAARAAGGLRNRRGGARLPLLLVLLALTPQVCLAAQVAL